MKYVKSQLLNYREFLIYNEVLKLILDDNKEYSIEEVKELLDGYFNKNQMKVEKQTENKKKNATKLKNEVND